jgi:hypothetical protein
MNKSLLIVGVLLLLGAPAGVHAADQPQMAMGMTKMPAVTEPVEPGQSAYAALGEVTRMLLADSQTDWAAVDVDALRNHLVDMDDVTLHAVVTKTRLPNGARFQVTGSGPLAGSIQRMTASHFAQPDFGRPWTMSVRRTASGADVTIVSTNPADTAEIYGLGFFGILTMGTHHQPHHLMMARGMMTH